MNSTWSESTCYVCLYVSTINTTIMTQWKFQYKHYTNTAPFDTESDIFVCWQISENIHAGLAKGKLYLFCILWVLRNHNSQAQEIWLYDILQMYLQIAWRKIAGICQINILYLLGVWHTFIHAINNSAQTQILYITTVKVA